MRTGSLLLGLVVSATSLFAESPCDSTGALTLTHAARNWQFLDAVGPHAGLLGREDGSFEAWIYPLKLFRDFRLQFRVGDAVLPGDAIPRTITVRPESSSVKYIYDSFTACATWFVPVDERGAVVEIEVNAAEPVAVEGSFTPDVTWMWPAALGDGYSQWDARRGVFVFSNNRSFYAAAGAAGITPIAQTFAGNYASGRVDAFSFGPPAKGRKVYRFVMAASFENPQQAEVTYRKLLTDDSILQQTRNYYARYLDSTVQLDLPDKDLELSYDWARVSTVQGLVDEPYAGKGLVAGYNIANANSRPGFSWYFGRDSMWTALALDSIGDFATTRTALEFLMQYQRPNGRIPHEIAQSVKLVDWWNDYPYGTASADGTPLFLVGFADYVRASGDTAFAREHWESLWRAYQFLKTTYSASGLSQNLNIGHGWIEGGPLRPQGDDLKQPHDPPLVAISGEFYQAGVGIAAVESLAALARAAGKNDVALQLDAEATQQRAAIEKVFWSPEKNYFAFAVDLQGQRIDKPSVLGTVPLWFGLTDPGKSDLFLNVIAAPEHQTDWGPRIISNQDPLYGPTGYHFGSVWPLFTGWASVGGYRYHRAAYGFENLKANAQLAHDGSPGRTTEVLSGDFYTQLATSTPHQIWSSAMVISPILRGMMGLEVNALDSRVTFAPHIPAGWTDFAIHHVRAGNTMLDFTYHSVGDDITLEVEHSGMGSSREDLTSHDIAQGGNNAQLEFSPAFSLRAKLLAADVSGRKVSPKISVNENDQHFSVSAPLNDGRAKITIHLRVSSDFAIGGPYAAPADGATSSALKFVSERWNAAHDKLQLQVAGVSGKTYEVPILKAPSGIEVSGARITKTASGLALQITVPTGTAGAFSTQTVTLQFPAR
jgi:glycogen debranching enzyme